MTNSTEGPEILDMEAVEDAKDAMKGKFATMVQYYLEDTVSFVEQIEAALSANETDKIVSPAHTLKSSSAQLGAMQVSDIARELEAAARGTTDGEGAGENDIASLTQRLRAAFEAVEPKFKEILDQQAA